MVVFLTSQLLQEALNRRISVQPSLREKQDPISKITKAKRAGGMAQAVEHLPIKHKAQYHQKIKNHVCNIIWQDN
jgi:hypothetical protein